LHMRIDIPLLLARLHVLSFSNKDSNFAILHFHPHRDSPMCRVVRTDVVHSVKLNIYLKRQSYLSFHC